MMNYEKHIDIGSLWEFPLL